MRIVFRTYDNTPENARKVGWDLVPELCFGSQTLPRVTHDLRQGTFLFHAREPEEPYDIHGERLKADRKIVPDPEYVVGQMARALFCCGRLHDPFSRAACYVSAGISNQGWAEGQFLVMDLRAVGLERQRRLLHRMGGDVG